MVGSPRSGTTFLAGAIGEQPGFVDLSEVNPHKAAIPSLVGLPEAEAAQRIRAVLERVRALALVRGWRGVEQTPETAFVLGAALAAYPDGRAVHLVRDGRDVVCSLLERGWLSAGRTGGDDARLAYGGRARFWVEPDRSRRVRGRERRDPRGLGVATVRDSAARSVTDPRVLELRYESIAADPAAAARTVAKHLGSGRGAARAEPRSIQPTPRSAATGRTCRPSSSPTSSARQGRLLRELGYD